MDLLLAFQCFDAVRDLQEWPAHHRASWDPGWRQGRHHRHRRYPDKGDGGAPGPDKGVRGLLVTKLAAIGQVPPRQDVRPGTGNSEESWRQAATPGWPPRRLMGVVCHDWAVPQCSEPGLWPPCGRAGLQHGQVSSPTHGVWRLQSLLVHSGPWQG